MTQQQKEFEFILDDVLKYADGTGSFIQAKKLLLRAPSPKHKKYSLKLKQGFMQAIRSNISAFSNVKNDDETKVKNPDINQTSSEEMLGILLMSDIDIVKFSATFEEMLFDGLCLVDGRVNLTISLYNELSDDETNRLMGEYMANFLVPSSMKPQKKV